MCAWPKVIWQSVRYKNDAHDKPTFVADAVKAAIEARRKMSG